MKRFTPPEQWQVSSLQTGAFSHLRELFKVDELTNWPAPQWFSPFLKAINANNIAITANKLGLSSYSSYIKRNFNGKLKNNFFNKLNQVLEYPEFNNLQNMVEMYLQIKYGDKNEDKRF